MEKQRLKISLHQVIILILMSLLIGYLFLRPSIRFTEERPILERGFVYPAKNFILDSRGEVTPEEEELYTEIPGEYSFHYVVKRWIFERDISFAYEVQDTIPPQISFKETTVMKDPDEEYADEQIRDNVSIDEGRFEYETDYDSCFPGVYSVNVTARDDYGNESSASYNVVVKDTEAPMILAGGYGKKIKVNSRFNILDIIAFGDNADADVKLSVEGEVNTAKTGRYPLDITLEDDSGNQTKWDIVVEVVSRLPDEEDEDDEYYYQFEDFLKEYEGENRRFGIDVSTWQGEIDYEAVKKAGCEFVIMRIGYSHQGKFKVDSEFERNISEAKKAGLLTGIYLFTYDSSEEELLSTLDQMFEVLGENKVDLPIVFDWEDFLWFNEYGMSFKDLNHLYDVFEEEVNNRGYEAMLYGSKYYLDSIWKHNDRRKIWLAQYTDEPTFEEPFLVWQLSDHGAIDGIDGHVDFDIWYLEEDPS